MLNRCIAIDISALWVLTDMFGPMDAKKILKDYKSHEMNLNWIYVPKYCASLLNSAAL
jgi:hypothetical protein